MSVFMLMEPKDCAVLQTAFVSCKSARYFYKDRPKLNKILTV